MSRIKYSICTASKRLGGVDTFVESLARQTVWKDLRGEIEWIFVDEHRSYPGRAEAVRRAADTLGLVNFTHVYPPDYPQPRFSKLNRARQTALDAARGEWYIQYDDLIWLPDDALERYAKISEEWRDPILVTCENFRTKVIPPEDCLPEDADRSYSLFREPFNPAKYGFPNVPLTVTGRPRELHPDIGREPVTWEAPWGMAPVAAMRDAGGWDEGLDWAYACDNQEMARRILVRHPRARIHFLRDLMTISLDHLTYFNTDPADMHARTLVAIRTVTPRIDHLRKFDKPKEPRKWADAPVVHVHHNGTEPHANPSLTFWHPDIGNWGKIDPAGPLGQALGGRETATIRLAEELSGQGWDITVLIPCTEYGNTSRITWKEPTRANLKAAQSGDVLVSCEYPDIFHIARARLNILHHQCCGWHPGHGVDALLDRRIDAYLLLSAYQGFTLRRECPEVDGEKVVILGNGVDLVRYDDLDVPTIPGRLVWSSSPDRGLVHLLRWWPTLKRERSDLSLKVFYKTDAMEPHRWAQNRQAEVARLIDQGRNLPDVEYVGPVDQATLAREQKQTHLWVYPCDPALATESACISAMENAAAGVPMILSDADCLPEVYGGQRDGALFLPLPINDRLWTETILARLANPGNLEQKAVRARKIAEQFTWANLGQRWDRYLRARLAMTDPAGAADLNLLHSLTGPLRDPTELNLPSPTPNGHTLGAVLATAEAPVPRKPLRSRR